MNGIFSCYSNFDTIVYKDVDVNNNTFNKDDKNVLKMQYQILFRQWDELYKQWGNKSADNLGEFLQKKVFRPILHKGEKEIQPDTISWEYAKLFHKKGKEIDVKIIDLLNWNLGYFRNAFLERGWKEEDYWQKLNANDEIDYYTSPLYHSKKNPNILELFFCGEQPLLDVQYHECQERPSKMLQDEKSPNYHLVFDEVGTGKTVSAFYCMRDVIARKKSEAKILIVCPNNKVKEWESDIQRQMGLYAHYVNSTEEKEYESNIKNNYFKENEPLLFIERQKKKIEMNEACNKWSEKDNIQWDLVIIDEGHLCFENYNDLRAKKALLLTATPIVSSENNTIKPKDYENKLAHITETEDRSKSQKNGLENLFSESNVFTQNFREDMDIKPTKRKIIFLTCNRWKDRGAYMYMLEYVSGKMVKMQNEQDDELLLKAVYEDYFDKIKEYFHFLPEREEAEKTFLNPENGKFKNEKYNELAKFLRDPNNEKKSYILFFERIWTLENISEKLIDDKTIKKDDLIIGRMDGKVKGIIYPKTNRNSQDNMLNYMQASIKNGKRVLFLATGRMGGTGLNLGKFDGVINYEVPFTCIELEQRFGRVDRMDENGKNEKELVFILNNDWNDRLRYSIRKIINTCEYMPIRNTILFYPDMMKKIADTLSDEMNKNHFSEEELDICDELYKNQKTFDNDDKIIWEILNKSPEIELFNPTPEQKDFAKYLEKNCEEIKRIKLKLNILETLEQDTKMYCNLFGVEEGEVEEDSFGFIQSVKNGNEEGEEGKVVVELEKNKDSNVKEPQEERYKNICNLNRSTLEQAIKDLEQSIQSLQKSLQKQVEEKASVSFTASGLYYKENKKYIRQTVKEFRKKFKA